MDMVLSDSITIEEENNDRHFYSIAQHKTTKVLEPLFRPRSRNSRHILPKLVTDRTILMSTIEVDLQSIATNPETEDEESDSSGLKLVYPILVANAFTDEYYFTNIHSNKLSMTSNGMDIICKKQEIDVLDNDNINFLSQSIRKLVGVTLIAWESKEAQTKFLKLETICTSEICTVLILNWFVKRTAMARKKLEIDHTLFLEYIVLDKRTLINSTTAANWMINILKEAGINTRENTTYSTRSAANTNAILQEILVEEIKFHVNWNLSSDIFEQYYFKPNKQHSIGAQITEVIFVSKQLKVWAKQQFDLPKLPSQAAISKILQKEEKILERAKKKLKKMSISLFWIWKKKAVPINVHSIKNYAKVIAVSKYNITQEDMLSFSDGWIAKLKKRLRVKKWKDAWQKFFCS
ncbi:Homeodomain-like DNA binding domain-containing transcription factor [Phycomyces blakesleeanus NRRL 1555(-)]|uniref:Homeodomain-like DNA binding domain-containing transcription factor n=1 Tax=Phycomyces blakesleeanus (strain ATCC 8743b / DSM 1359 / FGSC 10004 / NBRC 33097 / NRRL 1555) TaxID=763407 RepID=A0A163D2W0_PHYB8|nr:Homeodomain-like DNA binding domain-containing transcription factor [Phycomyces blakesleeanus NRRL 1555(-)]OAD68320.1 Homeodomain-like DNA binding domain-containing transcription factor [Phycomyces blakesleeanus NRRL 1555(-)]|eukprot:XP_018286360.1 Homeodomain-like DNA binding domain-containing transcription factor [Phycomyces blakesleeanus NRRL 1555(-)]